MNSVTEFGKQLLKTGDLDPVYIALHGANLDRPTLCRLVISYICFYHLGLAARLAEIKQPKKYWEAMMTAAINETSIDGTKPYPRGSERRHYRGDQATASMASLISLYPKGGEQAIAGFVRPNKAGVYTYGSVSQSTMSHRGFGEWIGFKVADIAEQVLGYDVDSSDCVLGVYKDPRQGAALVLHGDKTAPITDAELDGVIRGLVKHFKGYDALPRRHRKFGLFEAETVLCKFKSHVGGHYPLGKDTREIAHGLVGWGPLAEEIGRHLPKVSK